MSFQHTKKETLMTNIYEQKVIDDLKAVAPEFEKTYT